MEILYGAKNGVQAFGYNSAESEPISIKSGALWAHCWGLALVDFGHDPNNSDRLRGSRIFVFSWRNNARFHRFPIRHIFATFEHNNVDRWGGKNFRNRILTILRVFFPEKRKKLLTKFPGLPTSGRHNSAMITDRRKFTRKLTLFRMSSFHFYH